MWNSPFTHFVANLYGNAMISFILSWILIESFIFILRIKHPRLRSLLYAVPFFKLVFDICLYSFTTWSYTHNFSILDASIGSRLISAEVGISGMIPICRLAFSAQDGLITFSLIDVLLEKLPFLAFAITCICIIGSFIQLTIYLCRWRKQYVRIQEIVSASEKVSSRLYLSEKAISPFVFGCIFPKIVMAKSLYEQLGDLEKQAIIAHEESHIRWCDNLVHFFALSIAAIFWPVFGKNILSTKMQQYRELACDVDAIKSTSKQAVLQALLKAARYQSIAMSFTTYPILKRADYIMNYSRNKRFCLSFCMSLCIALIIFRSHLGLF